LIIDVIYYLGNDLGNDLREIKEFLKSILPIIRNISLKEHNLWTPSVISSLRNDQFRNDLKKHLGYGKDAKVSCMVSKFKGNGKEVIAAHIAPSSSPCKLKYVGLEKVDVNNVRNGLFLAFGIEKAFDKLQISFIKSNPLKDVLCLHIWDDECRKTPLWFGHKQTIGDFDGSPLLLGKHDPFKRCLSYQAYQAHLNSNTKEDFPLYFGTPTKSDFDKQMTMGEILKVEFFRRYEEEVGEPDVEEGVKYDRESDEDEEDSEEDGSHYEG